jgi:hypothetical protein
MRRLLAVTLLALAGCGPGSYREFRDQLVGAACDRAERCGQVARGDRAHCGVDDVLRIFHDSISDHSVPGAIDVPGSIDGGRMRYDSVNAQSCLDAVSGAPCEPMLAARRIGLGCNAAVAAHTETDRPCWGDPECTGGVCARAAGCAGICAAYASYGDPCLDSMLAPAAMRCDPTVAFCAPPSPGADPICQQKKPSGSDCTDTVQCSFNWTCRLGKCTDPKELSENEACGGTDPCDDSTFCNPVTGRCEKHHRQGEACTSAYGCEDRLGCLGLATDGTGAVLTAGSCTPWLLPGAACSAPTATTISGCPDTTPCIADACTPIEMVAARDEDCSLKSCGPGLACNAQKRCDFGSAVFGDCGGDRSTLCDPSLTCMSTSTSYDKPGVCVPIGAPACFQPAS